MRSSVMRSAAVSSDGPVGSAPLWRALSGAAALASLAAPGRCFGSSSELSPGDGALSAAAKSDEQDPSRTVLGNNVAARRVLTAKRRLPRTDLFKMPVQNTVPNTVLTESVVDDRRAEARSLQMQDLLTSPEFTKLNEFAAGCVAKTASDNSVNLPQKAMDILLAHVPTCLNFERAAGNAGVARVTFGGMTPSQRPNFFFRRSTAGLDASDKLDRVVGCWAATLAAIPKLQELLSEAVKPTCQRYALVVPDLLDQGEREKFKQAFGLARHPESGATRFASEFVQGAKDPFDKFLKMPLSGFFNYFNNETELLKLTRIVAALVAQGKFHREHCSLLPEFWLNWEPMVREETYHPARYIDAAKLASLAKNEPQTMLTTPAHATNLFTTTASPTNLFSTSPTNLFSPSTNLFSPSTNPFSTSPTNERHTNSSTFSPTNSTSPMNMAGVTTTNVANAANMANFTNFFGNMSMTRPMTNTTTTNTTTTNLASGPKTGEQTGGPVATTPAASVLTTLPATQFPVNGAWSTRPAQTRSIPSAAATGGEIPPASKAVFNFVLNSVSASGAVGAEKTLSSADVAAVLGDMSRCKHLEAALKRGMGVRLMYGGRKSDKRPIFLVVPVVQSENTVTVAARCALLLAAAARLEPWVAEITAAAGARLVPLLQYGLDVGELRDWACEEEKSGAFKDAAKELCEVHSNTTRCFQFYGEEDDCARRGLLRLLAAFVDSKAQHVEHKQYFREEWHSGGDEGKLNGAEEAGHAPPEDPTAGFAAGGAVHELDNTQILSFLGGFDEAPDFALTVLAGARATVTGGGINAERKPWCFVDLDIDKSLSRDLSREAGQCNEAARLLLLAAACRGLEKSSKSRTVFVPDFRKAEHLEAVASLVRKFFAVGTSPEGKQGGRELFAKDGSKFEDRFSTRAAAHRLLSFLEEAF